jgi:hypothetical protein
MRQNMLCIVILIRVLKNFSFFWGRGVFGGARPPSSVTVDVQMRA